MMEAIQKKLALYLPLTEIEVFHHPAWELNTTNLETITFTPTLAIAPCGFLLVTKKGTQLFIVHTVLTVNIEAETGDGNHS